MTFRRQSWEDQQRRRKPPRAIAPKRIRKIITELRGICSTIDFYLDRLSESGRNSLTSFVNTFYEGRLPLLLEKERELRERIAEFYASPSFSIPETITDIFIEPEFQQKCVELVPDFEIVSRELLDYFAKHPFEMQKLHWRKFEEMLAEILRGLGYDTRLGPGRADGGVDIWAVQKSTIGEMLILVQAKKYKSARKISLEPVSALYGVMEMEKANQAVLATTSEFEPSARQFAERTSNRIILASPSEIRNWIQEVLRRS